VGRDDTVEGGVDDVADESFVETGVAVEEAVVERAIEEVECEVDVRGRRNLARSIARAKIARP
jgi:hypothetical protein